MNKAKTAALIPDYLLSIPIAVSFAANLLEFFLVPQSQKDDLKAICLLAAAFLLFIHIVFYNKFTLKIFAAMAAAGAGIYFAAFYIAFHKLPVFSYSLLITFLFQIVIFGTCVIVYLGSKCLLSVFILMAGGLGLFFYMSFVKMGPEPKTYYVYLAGVVALLVKKLICQRLQIKGFKELAEVYGYSLCAAAIVLVIANFIYTQTDFRIVRKVSAVRQAAITGYNDLDSMENFGAPLILDNDVALTVDSSADKFYLKADTFDGYSNSKWTKLTKQSESNLNNFGNYMWMMAYTYENDHSFFNEHDPSDITAYIDYFKNKKTSVPIAKMRITHKSSNFKCLFLPTGFISFETKGSFLSPVTEDYSLKSNVPAGTPYTVMFPQPDLKSSEVLNVLKKEDSIIQNISNEWQEKSYSIKSSAICNRHGSQVQNSTKKLDSYSKAINSFDEYRSKIRAQYLKLSPSVTKRTKKLALSLTKDCANDYEKVTAIKQYLQKNCTYTLTPPQPENGEDLVDYFLFQSHIGYCAHFASAMTVLLRAAGVPARYVCGFVSPNEHDGNTFVITNEQAHAWTEVYSEALGFYTVDATRSISSDSGYTYDANNKKHDIQAEANNNIGTKAKNDVNNKIIQLAVKLSAVLAFILLSVMFAIVFFKHRKMKRLGPNAQAVFCFNQLIFILRKFGLKREPYETLYEFSDGFKENKGLYKGFRRVADIYLRAAYGREKTEKEDADQIKLFRKSLFRYMRSYACLPEYIVKRIFIALSICMGKT